MEGEGVSKGGKGEERKRGRVRREGEGCGEGGSLSIPLQEVPLRR